MVEILTLWSPHKLLKNLGALSEYAKCSQSLIKKIEILSLCPGYNGVVKKTSQATFPLIASKGVEWEVSLFQPQQSSYVLNVVDFR